MFDQMGMCWLRHFQRGTLDGEVQSAAAVQNFEGIGVWEMICRCLGRPALSLCIALLIVRDAAAYTMQVPLLSGACSMLCFIFA
jgi:hypothetical protein